MDTRERRRTTANAAAIVHTRPGRDDTDRPPPATPGGLVRVTVNLTPKSADSLDAISASTGLSKTDVINRALQVYQVVEELLDRGGGSILVKHPSGELERIYIV